MNTLFSRLMAESTPFFKVIDLLCSAILIATGFLTNNLSANTIDMIRVGASIGIILAAFDAKVTDNGTITPTLSSILQGLPDVLTQISASLGTIAAPAPTVAIAGAATPRTPEIPNAMNGATDIQAVIERPQAPAPAAQVI